MSHLSAIAGKSRAIIVIATVWAMMFGLVATAAASAAMQSAGTGASTKRDHVLMLCDRRLPTSVAPEARKNAEAPKNNPYAGHQCPECCLATHAGAAVLPERTGVVSVYLPMQGTAVAYAPVMATTPKSVTPVAVNGARAPPAPFPFS